MKVTIRGMKIQVICLIAGLAMAQGIQAEGPSDDFVKVFNLIHQGDQFSDQGEGRQATQKYLEAETALRQLQSRFPTWNTKVVDYRLNYLRERLQGQATPSIASVNTQALQQQVSLLQGEIQRLTQDRLLLEAKLREALSARPSAIDPRELLKAESEITNLQKEIEVLKVSLAQQEKGMTPQNEASLLIQTRQALEASENKLKKQDEVISLLNVEKELLLSKIKSSQSQKTETAASPQAIQGMETRLSQMQADMNQLQYFNEILVAEKRALENRLRQLNGFGAQAPQTPVSQPTPTPVNPSQSGGTLAASEKLELEQLRKEVEQLKSDLAKSVREAEKSRALTRELVAARARLEALEGRLKPMNDQEKALFKSPTPEATALAEEKTSSSKKALPEGAAPYLAEAQQAFSSGRFEEAKTAYLKVLELDPEHVFTLSNLAVIELELNHPQAAEELLQKALKRDPEDAYSLSLLGILKFRQEKFDEAQNFLSQSAQIDPENPETQNYLGIVLSQKGHRIPAETALRKAIQLNPRYASAHHNLAIIYATQQPPYIEMARWHYQKAISNGHPRNPNLEAYFDTP